MAQKKKLNKPSTPKSRKTLLKKLFGKAVKERRILLGLSQENVARRSGLHFTYVSSVERGERNISLENIVKLASALESHVSDLMHPLIDWPMAP